MVICWFGNITHLDNRSTGIILSDHFPVYIVRNKPETNSYSVIPENVNESLD